MNEKLSRGLLVAATVLIVLPTTYVLGAVLVATPASVSYSFWPYGAWGMITVVAAVALLAGWRLLIRALRGGSLRAVHRAWWWVAFLGPVTIGVSTASLILPASP